MSKSDVVSLAVSVVSCLVLVVGALQGGGSLLQRLVRQTTTGYDGVYHMSLTLSLYDNEGYVYGPYEKVKDKIIAPTLNSYPQGWSFSTSLWWHGASSHLNIQDSPARVLLLYFAAMVGWYALLLFLFCRFILYLFESINRRGSRATEYVGAVMFTLLAQILFFINLLNSSFASFYPALVFPLTLGFLTGELLLAKRSRRLPIVFLIGGLMISAGDAFSWLLAAPAAYLMVIIGLILYFKGSFMTAVRWLVSNKLVLISTIILICLAACQGIVQILYGDKALINDTGGAGALYNLVLVIFLVTSIISVGYSKHSQLKAIFIASITGIFCLTGEVYLYQVITSGTSNYYSTKIAYIAFMFVTIFAAVGLVSFVNDHFLPKTGQVVSAVLIAGLVLFLPVATGLDLSSSPQEGIGNIDYMKGKRFLSPYSSSQISALLLDKKILNGNLVVYKGLSYAEDITTTHFVQVLARKPIPACQQAIVGADLKGSWQLNPQRIIDCAHGQTFYVMSAGKIYTKLVSEFAPYPNIQVILSN